MGGRGGIGRSAARAGSITLIALGTAVALAACGGSAKPTSSSPATIHTGQVDIQLPPGWKVTKSGVERPAAAAPLNGAATPGATSKPGEAVPLAKEDPTTKFFKSLTTFQTCLKGLGVKFIGVPNASNPNSPANNPDYIKALSTCAAKSNILQALKDQQAAQDNLTPAQVEEQNKNYLKWRDCMIGRGWGIPEPKPDAKGRLFSFGSNPTNAVPAFTPPAGQDLMSSKDLTDCASEVQRANTGG